MGIKHSTELYIFHSGLELYYYIGTAAMPVLHQVKQALRCGVYVCVVWCIYCMNDVCDVQIRHYYF